MTGGLCKAEGGGRVMKRDIWVRDDVGGMLSRGRWLG